MHRFANLRLGAGKQAIIHTGKGGSHTTSASTHLCWGRGWPVWNNTGEKVILRGRLAYGTAACNAAQAARRTANVNRTALPELPGNPRSSTKQGSYVHEQALLLVTDAGLVTVIIGLAISLILIVIGSFYKKKMQL